MYSRTLDYWQPENYSTFKIITDTFQLSCLYLASTVVIGLSIIILLCPAILLHCCSRSS